MREALVEADAQPDAPREGRRQLVEGPLVALVAAAEHGELGVRGRERAERRAAGEGVEALLLGQAGDDAHDEHVVAGGEPQLGLERPLAAGLCLASHGEE